MEKLHFKDNIIKACPDEKVIEAVFLTRIYITPWYFDAQTGVSMPPELISKEYRLQTFFGNDIIVEIDKNDKLIDFALCNIRHVDWEDWEEELKQSYQNVNRDITRIYSEQCDVTVEVDQNWRREESEDDGNTDIKLPASEKIRLIWEVLDQGHLDLGKDLPADADKLVKIKEVLKYGRTYSYRK